MQPLSAECGHPADRQLSPWLNRARRTVEGRFADARAHAEAGDVQTAGERLDELRDSLVGPGPEPREGLIHDARASFYRSAIVHGGGCTRQKS